MTNYERIRSMSIEEMVESNIISRGKYYGQVPAYEWDDFDHTYHGDNKLGCKQWLEQESK